MMDVSREAYDVGQTFFSQKGQTGRYMLLFWLSYIYGVENSDLFLTYLYIRRST